MLTRAMRAKNFQLLDELDSVLLVSGHATFTGEREVLVTGGADTLRLSAETVPINTGSRPAVPAIQGARVGGGVHDSTTLQHVQPLPRSLIVVGGGYVGLEFASMFAHYGAAVTVLDRGARPLRREDPEQAEVTCTADGRTVTRGAEAVLLALGRVPATEGLGLDRAGVNVDERGFVRVDEHLRTTAGGVYALGDINGGPQFTYVSLDDNRIVSDQLFGAGERSAADRVAVPYTILVALAMRHSSTATELRDAIYTHPSATEALNEVLDALA